MTAPPAPTLAPPPVESLAGPPAPPPPRERPSLRARISSVSLKRWILIIGGAIAILLIVATQASMRGAPAVVVEAKAGGVVFRPDTTLDLVATNRGGADAAGVPLEPPYVHLRADSVTAIGYHLTIPPDADSTIGASALQRLVVSDGCDVYVDRLDRGWMRIGVLPATTTGAPAPPCVVRGQVWSGRPSKLPERSRPLGWVGGIPDMRVVEFHAAPTAGRPASLTFRPGPGLRLRRVPIAHLSFETREHGPVVESSILAGSIRLPMFGNDVHAVFTADTLSLGDVAGNLTELTAGDSTAGDSLSVLFRGTASYPRIGAESLKPTFLEWAYAHERLRLAVGLGLAAFGLIFGLIKDTKHDKTTRAA